MTDGTSIGEETEQLERSRAVRVKWCNQFGIQFGSFLKG